MYARIITPLLLLSCLNIQCHEVKNNMNNQPQQVIYEVGNPGFRGKTQIEIHKGGTVDLMHQQGENTERFSGKLTEDEVDSLYRLIERTNPCDFRSEENIVEPDDVPLKIKLIYKDSDCQFEGWESERFQNERLHQLISEFNNIAKKVSAGKVKY